MNNLFRSLLFLLVIFIAFGGKAPAQNARVIVIKNVSVVDVANGRVKPRLTVTIAGDRITKIEKTGNVAESKNAFVVDGGGKFLIPGLWDMHVHIDDQGEWMFPLFLANGVVGVRDLGSDLKQIPIWREMQKNESALMPRVVAAGPIVTGFVTDEDQRLVRVSTRAEGEKAVNDLAARGADSIKVYDYLSREAYLGIINRAAALKIPVEGHLPVSIDAAEAARLGQKSIEHTGNALGGMLLDVSTREVELKKELREKIAATPIDVPKVFAWATAPERLKVLNETFSETKAKNLARVLAKEKIWICPTITSFSRGNMPTDEKILTDSRLKYVPAEIRGYAQGYLDDFKKQSPETTRIRVDSFDRHLELYRILRRGKVNFLAGTDSHPSPVTFPGFSLHDELAEFVGAGFSPLEALQSATVNPAIFLGKTKDFGAVAVGKKADMILLDANPLENISNTKRIRAVVQNGKYFDRAELDKTLANVAAFHNSVRVKPKG